MHLEVTFRHMNARPEIRKRAESLFEKLHRFLDPAADAQLVVDAEHGETKVELVVTTRGHVAKALEEDEDLRTALDRAFHRVEDQLRRVKGKVIGRRRKGAPPPVDEPDLGVDDEDWEEEAAV